MQEDLRNNNLCESQVYLRDFVISLHVAEQRCAPNAPPPRLGQRCILVSIFSTSFYPLCKSSSAFSFIAGLYLPNVERRVTAAASVRSGPHLVPPAKELAIDFTKASPQSVGSVHYTKSFLFVMSHISYRSSLTNFYVKAALRAPDAQIDYHEARISPLTGVLDL